MTNDQKRITSATVKFTDGTTEEYKVELPNALMVMYGEDDGEGMMVESSCLATGKGLFAFLVDLIHTIRKETGMPLLLILLQAAKILNQEQEVMENAN